ncbi:hypothetical protein [Mycobacterium sp.]|uniref:hypothetical protein n=1 Tax=Mycobacterium sp. TaxID=1785 RepID=UPI003F97202C
MKDISAVDKSKNRYGPVSFVVALVHILIVGLFTWLLIPYSIVLVLPEVLAYMALSALIARGPEKSVRLAAECCLAACQGHFR